VTQRILMLLENGVYPEDRRVVKEANALVHAGYEVSVACPRWRGQAWRQTIDGVRVYRFPTRFAEGSAGGLAFEYVWAMLCLSALAWLVWLRRGFDVIHLHNPPDILFLIALPFKLLGKRVVFDQHDLVPELAEAKFGSRALKEVALRLEGLSCRVADAVITANDFARTFLLERHRLRPEKVTLVGNGPSVQALSSLNLKPPKLKADRRISLGYIGVLDAQDGVDYLIEAMDCLRRGQPDVDFVCTVIGDGSELPSLRRQVEDLGLDGRVRFAGWLDWASAMRELSACDLCVDAAPLNAYHRHNEPVKVLEYMALGRPMVLSDLPGHRHVAGDTALYARPADGQEFAARALELLDDRDRARRLGAAARKRFEEHFSWEAMSENLLKVYASLAQGARR